MPLQFDDCVFDEARHQLKKSGRVVETDAKVLELLAYFLEHSGTLISKDTLLDEVWAGRAVADNALSVAVAKLRKALGARRGDSARPYITNVYGRGYRFEVEVTRVPAESAPASAAALPFVGRATLLARLEATWVRARAGNGALVALLGEPGIGKTRLAERFAELHRHECTGMAWGVCRPFGVTAPLGPWLNALHDCAEARTPAGRELLHELQAVSEGAARDEELAETLAFQRSLDGITHALAELSRNGPWLFILDDWQWADAASLRLLAQIAGQVARLPLLVLITVRSTEALADDYRRRLLDYCLGHRNCERNELPRLSPAEVAEYARSVLGARNDRLEHAVFEKCRGNAFFMVELSRALREGAAEHDVELSGAALDIVRQRLRRESTAVLESLAAAAVLGPVFDVAVLAHVTERSPGELLDLLEQGRRSGVILPKGAFGIYEFGHDVFRTVLMEDLSPRERARVHLAAARAIERRSPSDGRGPALEVVHHLLAAAPEGDLSKTVSYALSAAAALAHASAHADAFLLLQRALGLFELSLNIEPRLQARVLLGLARSARVLSDARFGEYLTRAVTVATGHRLGDCLALAGMLAVPVPGALQLREAGAILEAACDALPEENYRLRAMVLAHLSWAPPHALRADSAWQLAERAEALAVQSGDREALLIALSAKMFLSGGCSELAAALEIPERIDRLVENASPLVHGFWASRTEFNRMILCLRHGDLTGMETAMGKYGAAVSELEHVELGWHYRRASIVRDMNFGRLAGIDARLAELQSDAGEIAFEGWWKVCAMDRAARLLALGDASALRELAEQLTIEPADSPLMHALKIRAFAQLGREGRARRELESISAEELEARPRDRDYHACLAHLAVAAVSAQSLEHARVLYELLKPNAARCVVDLSLHCEGSTEHFLGLLARALGRPRDAVTHFERALQRNRELGFRVCAVRTAYELGKTLLASDVESSASTARDVLQAALAEATALELAPRAAQLAELLRALRTAGRPV